MLSVISVPVRKANHFIIIVFEARSKALQSKRALPIHQADCKVSAVHRHPGVLNIKKQTLLVAAGALLILFALCASLRAEQLPTRVYTTADGMVSDRVSRIVRDPRGFLWFCTEHGLSRFDGYTFTNYTTAQGLPSNWINDLLITRDGQYWIATEGGLCRFDPDSRAQPVRAVYRPSEDPTTRITTLIEDRAGTIWCGTSRGLYRVDREGDQITFHLARLGLPSSKDDHAHVRNLLEDRRGNIWAALNDKGLHRITAGGRGETFTTRNGLPVNNLMGLAEDSEGRIWVGTRGGGLCLLAGEMDANRNVVARWYTSRDGLPCDNIGALMASRSGRLWVGTGCGLGEFLSGQLKSYASASIIGERTIWSLAEDRDGNLWIGSPAGAIKVMLTGLTTYTQADGLGSSVYTALETPTGELIVCSDTQQRETLNFFDGRRFVPVNPNIPGSVGPFSWRSNFGAIISRAGEWWIPTTAGLYRFPKVDRTSDLARVRPRAIYDSRNDLPGDFVTHLYEDSRGDIWIATHPHAGIIVRWERTTEKFHRYWQKDGWPSDREGPMDFCEDRAGNLWIGFKGGGIARLGKGRFRVFTTADGVGAGSIRDLLVDREGRLWIASSGEGLGRTDDPTKEQPQFTAITERDGLSSNETWCIVDDKQGRIYAGTARGLDRIDANGIRHYTTADGLANQTVEAAFRDRQGALWFATATGLSRLAPEPDVTRAQPDIFISDVRVNGNTQLIAGLGQSEIAGFEFGPAQNNIQIEFFGISFSSALKYQYKLENTTDWSAPSQDRSVNLASLQPGSYRFLVQAVGVDGATSQTPASVSFTILRPVWQRWWFLTPAVALVALLVYGAYRYRVAQLIQIERVRTRIATDLHDDIGSNLSVIRGLSDLLRHQIKDADGGVAERLAMIADVSSRSVEAMSDIIWAVNPSRDNTNDLAQRMRRFASDAFTSRNIEFAFDAPDVEHNTKIDTEARREVYLIFKEAVNNAVRHSGCSRAEVVMQVDSNSLVLKVSDDGKGFDQDSAELGNGVMSMRRRAEKLGGRIEIESRAGEGTTVILKAPLRH